MATNIVFNGLICWHVVYNMRHTNQTYVNPNKMGISIFSCVCTFFYPTH